VGVPKAYGDNRAVDTSHAFIPKDEGMAVLEICPPTCYHIMSNLVTLGSNNMDRGGGPKTLRDNLKIFGMQRPTHFDGVLLTP